MFLRETTHGKNTSLLYFDEINRLVVLIDRYRYCQNNLMVVSIERCGFGSKSDIRSGIQLTREYQR